MFDKAHEFTAKWEGGYINHPHDRGGETNLGITRRVWEQWTKERGLKPKAMRDLTAADVMPLYKAKYWVHVSHLPWPLSGVAYDICVNHGRANLEGMLQRIPSKAQPQHAAAALIAERERFYHRIVVARPDQRVFLKGWLRRIEAQKAWLQQQGRGDVVGSKVFLRDAAGKNIEWDGNDVTYGGVRIKRYPDGAIQLERV